MKNDIKIRIHTVSGKHFVRDNEIDLNKKYSVKEFIKICENAYGGEIIRDLKKNYR